MTPFMSLLLPIGVSAFAVFVITLIIHMTPWHRQDYVRLPDEDGVMNALRPFNIPPGDYTTPHPGSTEYMKSKEYDTKRDAGPVIWLTVAPNGPWQMGRMMGFSFLFTLAVSASVACIVGMVVAPGGDSRTVFHHIGVISFLSYAMGGIPMSIWYDRKWSTTFKNIVDSVIYAAATGWIFSMMWPKA